MRKRVKKKLKKNKRIELLESENYTLKLLLENIKRKLEG